MPRIQVNDIAMYYEIHGTGFPLLLIAGLGADHTTWDPNLIQELASKFQIIIFDNRGAGQTDCPQGPFSIPLFASDAAGLLDKLNISLAYILGHSMGGVIAQQMAYAFPQKVKKLVLCSTNLGPKHSISAAKKITQGVIDRAYGRLTDAQIIEGRVNHNFTRKFRRVNPEAVERFRQMASKNMVPTEPYGRQLKALVEFDSSQFLPNLQVPTLILHGKKDPLTPPANAKLLTKYILGAKQFYFGRSAHALYTAEPEATKKILFDFLV